MASKNSSPIYLKNYPEYTKWDLPIETFPLTEIWEDAVREYPDNQVIVLKAQKQGLMQKMFV
ncbi:MAG: hypothetical protein P8N25_03360 [Alphaproteobacteria bacterium]|nr:hypothetical protein [Alphaproteobacteria bacterium]